MSSTMLSLVG